VAAFMKFPSDPFDSKARQFSRREWLKTLLLSLGCAVSCIGLDSCRETNQPDGTISLIGGKQLETLEFIGEGDASMNTPVGAELDGRLFTDLRIATPEAQKIATENFYVRTRASRLLDLSKPWSIQLGLGPNSSHLSLTEIEKHSIPMGLNLMECAGNSRSAHFGMLSVADWAGMPLAELLDRTPDTNRMTSVLVSGFDSYQEPSDTSVAGAGWIFPAAVLRMSNAFLATTMNGEPLTRDHGAPVRLIVPGWYGCTCIKWINEIRLVDESTEATSQMQEYAQRTLQTGIPKLARDYQPATVDAAAMPVRIERWIVNNKIRYRIVGIYWGGQQPIRGLRIQFESWERYTTVSDIREKNGNTWGFWTFVWIPKKRGIYTIRMQVFDPTVRTRRLDAGYYSRTVNITDI
jgi:DMSO/TMAO reductase YedYZ molybdopterin-dependent catalytic subunit